MQHTKKFYVDSKHATFTIRSVKKATFFKFVRHTYIQF